LGLRQIGARFAAKVTAVLACEKPSPLASHSRSRFLCLVRLRDETRAAILAGCGEPDLLGKL